MSGAATTTTAPPTRILDSAERLVQTRGYNGFSYADVASEIGVTKAALHYHFAGKAELGTALVERYSERFFEALGSIASGAGGAPAKLEAFAGIYGGVLREGRMCLCGMLAADYETLPTSVQGAIVEFFDRAHAWLTDVVAAGAEAGELHLAGSPGDAAHTVISVLEGAMLVSRPYRDTERFDAAARQLFESLRLQR